MNEEDVTHVTRNKKRDYSELKLVIDIVTGIGALYIMTHPEALDDLLTNANSMARRIATKLAHQVSVWAARQDIRNLPETD